jgi:predicted  nucleic acid-binding Zn-ribbon protein
MRTRFRDLRKQVDALSARSAKLRTKRDQIEQAATVALRAQLDPVDAEIATVTAEAAPLREELARLASVLGGKT